MSNLDKIKKAWSYGWAAQLEWHGNEDLVVALYKDGGKNQPILLRSALLPMVDSIEQSIKITGYLYAGQLAGNEPIPEGQRFRFDKKVWEWNDLYCSECDGGLYHLQKGRKLECVSKEEIEPVFD